MIPETNVAVDLNQNPKTLRQRAAEAYAIQAKSEDTQHEKQVITPVASSKAPRTTRQRGKQRAKALSSGDSEFESDTPPPARKRPRRSMRATQPVGRQLRPRRTGS